MTFEEHHNAVEFCYHFYDKFIDFEQYFDKCDTLDDLKECLYDVRYNEAKNKQLNFQFLCQRVKKL